MKKVELSLKYMNKLKKATQSIDIYYNDLESEFVVKILNNLEDNPATHFRNVKLKKVIKEATAYLLVESEK